MDTVSILIVVVLLLVMLVLALGAWEAMVRSQMRAYQQACGDEDVLLVSDDRPCAPRFETYKDWTLGLD